jgi:tetratricopeptide (TPR) repeat protein
MESKTLMAKPFAGRSFLGTFALVFLAIAALFATDIFLAKTERAESQVEAARLFGQGRVLMQRGEYAEAIERIKDAMAIERGNRDYLRTLAQALFTAGKTADAESSLTELLQSDSTDGLASLIMGRVLVKEGRFAEAVSYFRRAIYGHWNEDAVGNQLRARFELIDLLAQHNLKEELLAELLPAQDQSPRDVKTQTRLGRLFLLAGSPARAADVFRGILHDAPANADAYEGLGEAEFARGHYRAAQRDFQDTLRLAPDDQAARRRLDSCNEVLMLDPTTRGVSARERFSRSLKLVELTLGETSQCAGQNPSPELRGLLDEAARALLNARVSTTHRSEASESNLELAEQLWQARKRECKSPPDTDSPLALVLARLAQ